MFIFNRFKIVVFVRFVAVLAALGFFVCIAGCASTPARPIYPAVRAVRPVEPLQFSRVDISKRALRDALSDAMKEVSSHFGPFDHERFASDFAPAVRDSLYSDGFCRVGHLVINGFDIDMDIYFKTNGPEPQLVLDVYLIGSAKPVMSMASDWQPAQY